MLRFLQLNRKYTQIKIFYKESNKQNLETDLNNFQIEINNFLRDNPESNILSSRIFKKTKKTICLVTNIEYTSNQSAFKSGINELISAIKKG